MITALFPIIVFGFLTYQNLKDDNEKASVVYINNLNTQVNQNILKYFNNISFKMNDLTRTLSFLEIQIEKNISNLQELQKEHVRDYFDTLDETLATLSQKDIFQYVYSFKNKQKKIFTQLDALQAYTKNLKTPNVLMINSDGDVLYSSNKEVLLNKNVQNLTPQFAKMWKKIKKLKTNKNIVYVQISYNKYTNKYEQYAITHFKDVDGYIAIEVDLDHIKKDLYNVSSLGLTAETFLVYKENNATHLVYDRHTKHEKQGQKKANPFISLGFTHSGITTKKGSTGKIELVGYSPLKIRNITYSMQTTVSYIEVISPKIHQQNYFEYFIKGNNYTNLFLIDNDGEIFYSVQEEDDDYHHDNIFSHAVKEVFKTKQFVLTRKEKSPTRKDAIVSQFALMPIINASNKVITVIAIKLDNHTLANLLKVDTSIYKSTQMFLISQNKTLPKSNDTFLISNSKIDYSHLHFNLVTKIKKQDILANLHSLKINIYLFLLISMFITIISMYIITNEKKKNDKRLKHELMHDNLTNLPNRKYATEFLQNSLSNAKRNKTKSAVLFIDLDKFKSINDTYGHKAGDNVLIEIAKRFQNVIRENDLVARLGGDEFLIVLNHYEQLRGIENVCQKLLATASQDIVDQDNTYKIGLSIGIATYPADSIHSTELLTYADTAMYATKESGRHNFTYYNHEMMKASLKTAQLEQEIQSAISNNELILHYQPQVQLKELKVIGVEALVRWNHPKQGLVMPNDFIPTAENSNLIVDLGYWVLMQVCKDFLNWQTQGYTLKYVAVNMSTKQLSNETCVPMVLSILKALDFNPKNLELEITETTLIADFDTSIANINTFKEHGIKISIDDFGTGYSSLSYLKSLHISTLKIDREFIKDILTNRDDRTIVTAIIAMGHALDYSVIAEGVEEKAEIELLKYLACDTIQGYYFSKPLSAQKLLEFIDKGIND